MQEFKDKVAVITGGASGIGLALAKRFAREGMKLVLADIEEESLRRVEQEFRKAGVPVLAIRTDVSRSQDVERLAEKTLATFGAVHVVCNNAGVAPGGVVWENTTADWEWVLGRKCVGSDSRRARVRADHAAPGYALPRRQHSIGRRTAVGPGHGHVLRLQARGGDAERMPAPRHCRARREDRRVGAVPGVCTHRDHRLGTQSPGSAA